MAVTVYIPRTPGGGSNSPGTSEEIEIPSASSVERIGKQLFVYSGQDIVGVFELANIYGAVVT